MHKVMVLGGYGFFGSRICRMLAVDTEIELFIGGRRAVESKLLAKEIGLPENRGISIDAHAPNLAQILANLAINTVVHTAGPFQSQNYAVAKAAISAGAHYVDLADGRDFVAGIGMLDALAKARNVLVTSGASSLPALSSAVVDRYSPHFAQLHAITHGIGSGARAPGIATMRGVFGYCGKTFDRLEKSKWRPTYGWLDTIVYKFPAPVGARLLGSCDVPDLTLFPKRYPNVRTVTFHAGFASLPGHLVVWFCSLLVRVGFLKNVASLATPLHAISGWLEPLVSDKGGMFVSLCGVDHSGAPLKMTWHLIAAQNHGPQIPCGAAVALVKKLARGDIDIRGAMPCMGLISVEEYLGALKQFDVRELPP